MTALPCQISDACTDAAASLYVGEVMHARLKPIGHRFSYRVMSLLIDLDRLDEADRQSRLFGVNRAALYSFHEADHGARDGSSLRAYAQRCAAEHGIDLTGGRVLLLCYPRLLGYTFNPLSVYFCYRADGELALLIYEVRNTFGDIHPYVLPVTPGEISDAGVRQQQDKLFYVSPFIEMAMRYHFRVAPPGERVKLRILETDARRPAARRDFQWPPPRAHHHGRCCARSSRLPLVTMKIMAAIHWEALRLWLKGARLVPRPNDAARNTGLATGEKQRLYFARRCPPDARRLKQGQSADAEPGYSRRFDGSPMPELISVTSETVDATFPELPRLVRLALGFGSKLQHGTLDVTLADGRAVRLGGNGPGPAAAMTIYDYGFASRLLRGGDIGIAEAYLRGEWDTPDLTQFLYLFCVNQDWMQSDAGRQSAGAHRSRSSGTGSTATPGGRRGATSMRITTSATRSIRRGSIRA